MRTQVTRDTARRQYRRCPMVLAGEVVEDDKACERVDDHDGDHRFTVPPAPGGYEWDDSPDVFR